ncbi:MAG TPA: PAS domain-containing protein, partial [Thermoanaerobaculia bacterium]|nr:PAS domain-containing protein [Thermoanaerobaculia bacterium]
MPPRKNAPQREWLRATLDSLRDAVFALDPEGNILLLNRSAERLLGTESSSVEGRAAADLLRLLDPETGQSFPLPLGP